MKTILAIWHSGEKGKTETVREIANNLMRIYPSFKSIYPNPVVVPSKYDFRLVIEINGKIIGLESQGDPKTNLKKRIEELITNYNCDIIFCTTRTRGETVRAVESVANNFGYDQIWTSTYQTTTNHSLVNDLKAKHIIDLTQKLGLI
jgi:ABC-type Zn uptake system ZnuABC Zn-binding protein ZnuA